VVGASQVAKPPIIAVEGYDVTIDESVEHAEAAYCLAQDALQSTFFDATGRILSVEVVDDTTFRLRATDAFDVESLRTALIRYLRHFGEPIGDDASLDWLIERRLDRERHPPPLFNFWPFRRRSAG
jgi:hypothetical protein